ncbi:MAG: septal ring lytic transglycosylase RlpA family protein [Bacteriovoracaceae bacterium]|jgi:rare lipoprotein A|nr:septal ring lytic transglycosylase RlpA family protein [Bacteriovoracaceae bacterium]
MNRRCKNSSEMWRPSWRISRSAIALLLILLAYGCASWKPGTSIRQEEGIASWYGKDFHGRPTASGEIYDMYGFSAAHKTIPLGSTVRVTHLGNGRSIVVPINDRGPFVGERIIDLSYGAARHLGMVKEGIAKVRVEVLQISRTSEARYTLQFGAFTERRNAVTVAQRLRTLGYPSNIEEATAQGKRFYRVRHGEFTSLEQARKQAESFNARGITCVVIGL